LARKIDKRKGFVLLLAIFILNALTFSQTEKPIRQGSVEFFVGSYSMNEPRFDAVYAKGGLMVGLGLSAAIVSNFNIYLEAKYYNRTGKTTFSQEETKFTLIPISLGGRYIFPLGLFNPYVGAGADFYFYHEKNPIGDVLNHTAGVHFMGGTYIRFLKTLPLMLSLKLKYTTAKATEKDVQVQLGGFEYGVGLVFAF
jgi:opacity protein-like surface antigen